MANQIALVIGNDWQAVFINDKLVFENHYITLKDISDLLLYKVFDSFDLLYVDQDWLDGRGVFACDLPDVKLDTGKTVRETRG